MSLKDGGLRESHAADLGSMEDGLEELISGLVEVLGRLVIGEPISLLIQLFEGNARLKEGMPFG